MQNNSGNLHQILLLSGFPRWCSGKEPTCNAGGPASPWCVAHPDPTLFSLRTAPNTHKVYLSDREPLRLGGGEYTAEELCIRAAQECCEYQQLPRALAGPGLCPWQLHWGERVKAQKARRADSRVSGGRERAGCTELEEGLHSN